MKGIQNTIYFVWLFEEYCLRILVIQEYSNLEIEKHYNLNSKYCESFMMNGVELFCCQEACDFFDDTGGC